MFGSWSSSVTEDICKWMLDHWKRFCIENLKVSVYVANVGRVVCGDEIERGMH